MSIEPANTLPDPAARIADLERQLNEANQRAASIEQAHRINELLREAQAIDLDTARLLVERAMSADASRQPAAVVAEIVASKPFLFSRDAPDATSSRQGPSRTGVMGPRQTDPVPAPLVEAADEARLTGRRGDVLRYLRLRRAR